MNKKIGMWIFVLGLGVILPAAALKIFPWIYTPDQTTQTVEKRPEARKDSILLLHADGTTECILLEDYVTGVVLAEMPAQFEQEALKAQAVLARTYGLKRTQSGDKHPDRSLCTQSTCCQAYMDVTDYLKSGNKEELEKVTAAVGSTEGQVLTYNGQLIEATYFSCSGGSTEDAVAVWGTEIPYLQATESPGEEKTKHYVTTTQMTLSAFLSKLGIQADHAQIGPPSYTDGGGIQQITIGDKSFTGVQLRQLLDLKSTAIRMSIVGDHVIITTKGFGHRVGLSQYGAEAMAAEGSTYDQILAHYYKGTELMDYQS